MGKDLKTIKLYYVFQIATQLTELKNESEKENETRNETRKRVSKVLVKAKKVYHMVLKSLKMEAENKNVAKIIEFSKVLKAVENGATVKQIVDCFKPIVNKFNQ